MKIESIALPGYPPETAPKDKMFLGDFGFNTFRPAIWCPTQEKWCVAVVNVSEPEMIEKEGTWRSSFGSKYRKPEDLVGWHPMVLPVNVLMRNPHEN